MRRQKNVFKLVLSAMFIAVGLVLPFFTGQIPKLGHILCLMHIPVLLCGFICGWKYGFVVGLVTPLLRNVLFMIPILYPTAITMAIELATYGLVSGLVYKMLNQTRKPNITKAYIALILAMFIGRAMWGLSYYLLTLIDGSLSIDFIFFMTSAYLTAWPGILIQFWIIPYLIYSLERLNVLMKFRNSKF